MRRLCIIVFSVLLVYSSVAQALGACSVERGHSDHNDALDVTGQRALRHPGPGATPERGSSSKIHCLKLNLQIGPMVATSRVRFSSPFNHDAPLWESAASVESGLYGSERDNVLKLLTHRSASISVPVIAPFRLYLSVFQI